MKVKVVLLRVLAVLPCSLFIPSIFAPFLEATYSPFMQIPEGTFMRETFWSFKKHFISFRFGMDLKVGEACFLIIGANFLPLLSCLLFSWLLFYVLCWQL